jgi:hypothetical protein
MTPSDAEMTVALIVVIGIVMLIVSAIALFGNGS